MKTEGFLDDIVEEGKLTERLVAEGSEVLPENTLLLPIEVLTVKSLALPPNQNRVTHTTSGLEAKCKRIHVTVAIEVC